MPAKKDEGAKKLSFKLNMNSHNPGFDALFPLKEDFDKIFNWIWCKIGGNYKSLFRVSI